MMVISLKDACCVFENVFMIESRKNNNTGFLSDNRAIKHFSGSGDFVFLYKKTERISAALYMVTGLIDKEEPLRLYIRQKAASLIDILLSFREDKEDLDVKKSQMYSVSADLISQLNVASVSGMISRMNASVISKELNLLSEKIEKMSSDESANPVFSKTFFDISEDQKTAKSPAYQHSSVRNFSVSTEKTGDSHLSNSNSEDIAKRTKPAVRDKKNRRQRQILKLIKEKGEISVKDATQAVSGYSEKTLQRELSALVEEGVLKKEGKRRWTKYSFA